MRPINKLITVRPFWGCNFHKKFGHPFCTAAAAAAAVPTASISMPTAAATNANSEGLANRNATSPLVDRFGRFHNYLRISLVEKCNLRCDYCMPEEGIPLCPSSHLLKTEEIVRLGRLFITNGVDKVRLTGGEPTIRKDLVTIVGELAKIPGIREIGMTTNGVVLNRMLPDLIGAGLTHLNISLDTLNADKYIQITRRNAFDKVWRAIMAAEETMPKGRVKLNCVLMRGVNDGELIGLVELGRERALDVRFIEFMPFTGNRYEMAKFMPYREMLAKLEEHYGKGEIGKLGQGPHETSKAFKVRGFVGQFGFISSMSEHFCGGCNRLRITSDGNLKVCLHGQAEISLRDPIRGGCKRSGFDGTDWGSGEEEGSQTRRLGKTDENGRFPARWTANGPNWGMKEEEGKCKNGIKGGGGRGREGISSSLAFGQSIKTGTPRHQLAIGIHHHPIVPCSHHHQSSLFSFSPHFHFQFQFPSLSSSSSSSISIGRRHFCSFKSPHSLSHLDPKSGDARMVDIGGKLPAKERVALAQAIVQFPNGLLAKIISDGNNKKGDIFAVSRVGGILGAKSVPQLIPLCHSVPLSSVRIQFLLDLANDQIVVQCRAKAVDAKTGVEMEAMVGCSLAALTIYDMTKAASLGILIGQIKLMGKRGGKRDFGQTELVDNKEKK